MEAGRIHRVEIAAERVVTKDAHIHNFMTFARGARIIRGIRLYYIKAQNGHKEIYYVRPVFSEQNLYLETY